MALKDQLARLAGEVADVQATCEHDIVRESLNHIHLELVDLAGMVSGSTPDGPGQPLHGTEIPAELPDVGEVGIECHGAEGAPGDGFDR